MTQLSLIPAAHAQASLPGTLLCFWPGCREPVAMTRSWDLEATLHACRLHESRLPKARPG